MPAAVHVHLQLRIVGDDGTVFTDSEIKSPIVFCSVFGNVTLSSPRFYRCGCQPADSQTFSPLTGLLTEHTAPELLYLESRWASLISFGMTAALLKDVLPVADTTNPETVRQHLHKIAARQDADLGASELGLSEDGPAADPASLIMREAVIVGIDGAYLRSWHDKRKKFEVIVGKSMAEDRDDRYLVRSQDAALKQRLSEVLRRQGLPVDQPVTVLAATVSARSSVICRSAASITWTGSVRPEGCQGPHRPDSPQG